MKKITLIIIFVVTATFAQKEKSTKLGSLKREELLLKSYSKDTTANALVLYEHANLYLDEDHHYDFRTDYYYRIKLFKKEAFNKAIIKIFLYKKQQVKEIKGITYNLQKEGKVIETSLKKDQIFVNQENENYKSVSFTLPNLKEGCVVEFKYSIISPYSRLKSWYFQSDIPKIKSEYDAAILGNYEYRTRLVGFLKLDKDKPSIKKNCMYVKGVGRGDCAIYSYGMDSIPVFEEEEFMLSKENFISKVVFDLKSFTSINRKVKEYTKTWKDTDKTFKKNYLEGQTSKYSFFKKQLPQKVLSISNPLEKAKKVYRFIKKHYTWNGRNWESGKMKIKSKFKQKSGSVAAINLALYNSLKAAKIASNIVMISTRENGLPTKLYPVTKDFNYIIVRVVIEGKTYFLDATEKLLPFGMLPYRCLNGEGRVLDFKKGSYWELIKTIQKTSTKTVLQLELKEDQFIGKIKKVQKGYPAFFKRKQLEKLTEEEYLEELESKNPNLEIDDYKIENKETNLEEAVIETFWVTIDNDDFQNNKKIRFNPFFTERITKNPFKLNKRDYPVDFGYIRSETYLLTLKIPENYIIKKLPKNSAVTLPNKGGRFIFRIIRKGNRGIQLYFKFDINRKIFSNQEYFYLKEFYKQLIATQKGYIELEKK